MSEADDEPLELAGKYLGRELLEGMVAELEAQPKRWSEMSESDQHLAIERMRNKVTALVAETMRILFQGEYPACAATMTSLSARKGLTAVFHIAKDAANRHVLMDCVDQRVVILMADPGQYLEDLLAIKAKGVKVQRDLFTPPELPGMPESDLDDAIPEPEDDAPVPVDEADMDEANWVETGNDWKVERNTANGSERRSTRQLTIDLIEKITSFNMRTDVHSIGFDEAELNGQPRVAILLALQWLDGYILSYDADMWKSAPDFLHRGT